MRVHLVHNGKAEAYGVCRVGTSGATLATFLAVAALKPDLVISGGTSGGFRARGAGIASIFVSTECRNHDRHIPLPGYDRFGVESVPSQGAGRLSEALGARPLPVRRVCQHWSKYAHAIAGKPAARLPRPSMQDLARVWVEAWHAL